MLSILIYLVQTVHYIYRQYAVREQIFSNKDNIAFILRNASDPSSG